jgi:hypothetical protein
MWGKAGVFIDNMLITSGGTELFKQVGRRVILGRGKYVLRTDFLWERYSMCAPGGGNFGTTLGDEIRRSGNLSAGLRRIAILCSAVLLRLCNEREGRVAEMVLIACWPVDNGKENTD